MGATAQHRVEGGRGGHDVASSVADTLIPTNIGRNMSGFLLLLDKGWIGDWGTSVEHAGNEESMDKRIIAMEREKWIMFCSLGPCKQILI